MKKILSSFAAIFMAILAANAQTTLAEHHFESEGLQEVSVVGVFCDVHVTKGDQVIFDGIITGDGDPGDYLIASIKSGNQVVFKVERKKGSGDWGWNNLDVAKFDIVIPDGISLKIETTSGDIKLEGINGQEFDFQATSGDLSISETRGEIEARTTSGDATFRKIGGDIAMRSTSGDQEFYEVKGNVKSQATSGNIELEEVIGNVELGATSGDISIEASEGSVAVRTTSGNIEGKGVTLTRDSRARSTSGDIYFKLLNDLQDVGFDLDATSGDLDVDGMTAEDELRIVRGSIRFEGISTSGDQVYEN